MDTFPAAASVTVPVIVTVTVPCAGSVTCQVTSLTATSAAGPDSLWPSPAGSSWEITAPGYSSSPSLRTSMV
nr:hypothetical protein [Actinorhabdospora filicis]